MSTWPPKTETKLQRPEEKIQGSGDKLHNQGSSGATEIYLKKKKTSNRSKDNVQSFPIHPRLEGTRYKQVQERKKCHVLQHLWVSILPGAAGSIIEKELGVTSAGQRALWSCPSL